MKRIILAVVLASLLFTGQAQAVTTVDLQDQYRQTLIQLIQLLMKQVELLQAQLLIAQQKESQISALQSQSQTSPPTIPDKPRYELKVISFKAVYSGEKLNHYKVKVQFTDLNNVDMDTDQTLVLTLENKLYWRNIQDTPVFKGVKSSNPFTVEFDIGSSLLPSTQQERLAFEVIATYKGLTYRVSLADQYW